MKFYAENKFQDVQAGKIPANWKVVEIKDIASVKEGIYGRRSDDGNILQLKADSIRNNGKINSQAFARITIGRVMNDYLLNAGDVLLNNRNSTALVGKSAIFRGEFSECVFGNLLTRIRIHSKDVLPGWLLYRLMQLQGQGFLRAISTRAVNQALLKKGTVDKIAVPLPPISEQHAVIQVLDATDAAIELADKVIAKTERLKKGLMQQLLTRGIGHTEYKDTPIGKTPKTWQTVKLEDVSDDFIGGGTPSTSNSEYWNGDIAWMTSAHISERLITAGQKYITKKGVEGSATHIVPKNNLLVATRVGIGKVAINKIDIAISQDLTGVTINKEKALPEFLYWVLRNSRHKLSLLAQGSTIKGILRKDLGRLSIPLPSLPEQKKIDEILSTVDKKLELDREERTRLESVKRGLMDLLLTGKVRVKVV